MPDRSYRPMIEDRAYAIGTGPVVCVDQSHNNFYTSSDGFWPFHDLVSRDGYVVRAVTTIEAQSRDAGLRADCRILVIASPRSRVEPGEARRWVAGGGRLLLIADRDNNKIRRIDSLGIIGVRGGAGPGTLGVEFAGGLRVASYGFHSSYHDCETSGAVTALEEVAEARARGELWLGPWITAGAVIGASVIERSAWMAGVYVGVHSRAFGGGR